MLAFHVAGEQVCALEGLAAAFDVALEGGDDVVVGFVTPERLMSVI